MEIVFATNNKHKLDEVRRIVSTSEHPVPGLSTTGPIEILSLADINCHDDIPETGATLQENAVQKAQYIYEKYGLPCFADDTGLEVQALNGEPGIYSARYAAINNAGESHDSEANMTTLLKKLEGKEDRRAQFKTVIALVGLDDKPSIPSIDSISSMDSIDSIPSIDSIDSKPSTPSPILFSGIVTGQITLSRSGAEGFGYDPIFRPDGYDKTFAELGNDIKNTISHRARAVAKLAAYLTKTQPGT